MLKSRSDRTRRRFITAVGIIQAEAVSIVPVGTAIIMGRFGP